MVSRSFALATNLWSNRPTMTDDLSAKMRTYLSEIYRLCDIEQPEDGYVSTSALADMLYVTAPAVNRMINRLKEQDLLDHEPYQGIRLTDKGREEALQHLRVHRIAESFLVNVMGVEWENCYEEANKISTALSDVLLDRMTAMVGNPQLCPHGEPIPNPDGEFTPIDDFLLSDAEPNTKCVITRMRTREQERLGYIKALGLMPQTEVEVLAVAPFNGPIQLKIDDEYRIVGYNLAELIRVKKI